MKRFCLTIALALTGVMTIGAQDQKIETKTKTRIDVASGDTMVLTGCVRPYGTGAYMLTNVSSKNGPMSDYLLVATADTLKDRLDKWVVIEGKAATSRNGKVKIETETKVKPDGGETTETHDKNELKKGDLAAQPYLGVKSIKVLADHCR
jgi:hypothetical protein